MSRSSVIAFGSLLAAGLLGTSSGSARAKVETGRVETHVVDKATGKPLPCRVHHKDASLGVGERPPLTSPSSVPMPPCRSYRSGARRSDTPPRPPQLRQSAPVTSTSASSSVVHAGLSLAGP